MDAGSSRTCNKGTVPCRNSEAVPDNVAGRPDFFFFIIDLSLKTQLFFSNQCLVFKPWLNVFAIKSTET